MYINDGTFKRVFKEILDYNLTKEDIIDYLIKYLPDYQLENIIEDVYGIEKEEE